MQRTAMNRRNFVHFLALIGLAAAGVALAQMSPAPDTPLASNGAAKVTIADYEASILRIPENDRFGWAMNQDRINKEIENLLRIRTVAAEAKKKGLDADPALKARVQQYQEKLLAEALAAKVDEESIKDFEAKQAVYVERAREQYLVNKQQFQVPAQVKASHILIRISGRSVDEALAKAKALRARIVAGEPFEAVAATDSDDPTARQNKGELGFFGPGQMDPAFETAAFALTKPGEISEPVRSQFGFHLIRFEERKPARQLSFEDARPELLEKLKTQYIEGRRAQFLGAMFDPAKVEWNEKAVAGLKKTVDPALMKSVTK